MCIELLLIIGKHQRDVIEFAVVGDYIRKLDNLLEIYPGFRNRILELAILLLRLNNVNGALKGNDADFKKL